MRLIIAAAILAVAQARPALIYTHPLLPLGVEYAHTSVPAVRPHPAVERNAAREALLPRDLLKSNDFYDNPSIAAGLAKESWFTNKEMQVVEREAEKIPRERIYHIVKSAGFLD
ncbi:uncharacterized protein LOC106131542 [Amyelois transitella]|uniref:uncharacterized protein LOC106131542 n=1 Tax=Amyelois transitella TaxID=680683 RepID=UPI00067AA61F|nr:uncharacterized protein LOC106131542 [Amyelois transitella]XP_060806041.1 uncharacterized protein LOC106131542 [Amyelois transitella]